MVRKYRFYCACLLLMMLGVMLVSGCSSKASAEQAKFRVGVIKALGTVSPYVARSMGYFQSAGLDVELIDFPDGPTMMEAFVSGNIDITYGGLPPTAIWCSQGVKIKVIAATNSGGHLILVREDSALKSLSDLKGKRVATPKAGSGTDILFRSLVLKRLLNLDPNKDLHIVTNIAPQDMPVALLLTKEVDAIVTWEPYAAECLVKYGKVRVLFNFPEHWSKQFGRVYPVNVVAARDDVIAKRPDDLKRFLQVHKKTQDFINKDVARADEIIAKELGLTKEVVSKARPSVEFTYDVHMQDCITMLEYALELGYIKKIPATDDLFYLKLQ